MANQMYNSMMGYNNPFSMNPNFNQQFANFASQFNQVSNCTPQETVQQLLNSGRMTQQQFDQYRSIANMMTGRPN